MTPTGRPQMPVLLVDDEPAWLHSLSVALRSASISEVVTCQDSRTAATMIERERVGVVVLDLTMPHLSGDELLKQIVQEHPEIPVIIVTAVDDINTAVACMKLGAFDYFVKSVETERLVSGVCRAVELRKLRDERDQLRDRFLEGQLEYPEAFAAIATQSQKMFAIFQYLEAIAPSNEPALVTGETGVGKELFARAIHEISGRTGEFVAVNVAGLDDHTFSDTLFGHKKGAFTGADASRPGLVERAVGGTLFLDEIGDLAPSAQVKLLRLIQEREYYPLGSDVAKKSSIRIVVATNRDLAAMTRNGGFRKDLYYRLGTHRVDIPPLRERKEDLFVLLNHFLEGSAAELGKKPPTAPRQLATLLATYHFPGNVRELKAMVHEAVTQHTHGVLSMDVFRKHIRAFGDDPAEPASGVRADSLGLTFPEQLPTIKDVTEQLIAEAMLRASGNQSIAAEMLGMSRQALNKRLRQSAPDESEE